MSNINDKFEFVYSQEVAIEEFYFDYKVLEKFISIGSGSVPSIEKIQYYHPQNIIFPNAPDIIKPLRVFAAIRKTDVQENNKFQMLYNLEDVLDREQMVLCNWNDKRERILPAINLYYSILNYRDMPQEMYFLNIVQALETYHSRFKYGDKLKKYKNHLKELFRCEIEEIPEPHKEAYYCATQADDNVSYIILKSRLVDLFNDDFCLGMYPVYVNGEVVEMYSFIDTIVDTRHYYTHYGKSKENKALKNIDLEYGIRILMILFEYHFLKELGFELGYIKKRVDKSLSNVNYWYTERAK